MSRFAVVNQAITDREATLLGQARAAGIFDNPKPPRLTITGGNDPSVQWPPLPWAQDEIETSNRLEEMDWGVIENPVIHQSGSSSIFEPETSEGGRRFFRIQRSVKPTR